MSDIVIGLMVLVGMEFLRRTHGRSAAAYELYRETAQKGIDAERESQTLKNRFVESQELLAIQEQLARYMRSGHAIQMSCLVEDGPTELIQAKYDKWQNEAYRWMAMHPRLGNRYAVRFMSTVRVGEHGPQMKGDSDYAAVHNGVGLRLAQLDKFITELL